MSALQQLIERQANGEKLTSLEFAVFWCTDKVAAEKAAEILATMDAQLHNAICFLREVENDVHCDNDGRGCGASRKAGELADEITVALNGAV